MEEHAFGELGRGNLNTYLIHLGSANILIEPHGTYLCIVPDRRPASAKLFLPFEDQRITGRTITSQLR